MTERLSEEIPQRKRSRGRLFDSERPAEETPKQENQTNLARDGNMLVFRVLIRGFGDSSASPADTYPSPTDNRRLHVRMLNHCTSSAIPDFGPDLDGTGSQSRPSPPKNVRNATVRRTKVYVHYCFFCKIKHILTFYGESVIPV